MINSHFPGTYTEEISLLSPSVTEVQTTVPVFIGYTEKADEEGALLWFMPMRISSMAEFELHFGGASSLNSSYCLYETMQLFFQNGGRDCYVISAGDYTTPISFADLDMGLQNSFTLMASLLVIPESSLLPTENECYLLQQNMLKHCKTLGNRFAILSTRKPTNDADNDVKQFRNGIGNDNLGWGAAYYPWVISAFNNKKIPAAGAIAGAYGETDINRGVWKAPDNSSLKGVNGITNSINDRQNERLNIDESGKSVNAIRYFKGKGTLIWGARTLTGNDNEWRYVPVRRFFMMVEDSVSKSIQWAVFENNDANTWMKVKSMVENFLFDKWREGALAGSRTDEAYFVKCGLGETMNSVDIFEGKLIIEIGMAAVKPAEFIILKIALAMRPSL